MYKKFAELLKRDNKSVYRVSVDTGIAQSTLSDWKSGRCTPKVDKLQILANYFGVSIEYFLSEDEQDSGVTVEELASGG